MSVSKEQTKWIQLPSFPDEFDALKLFNINAHKFFGIGSPKSILYDSQTNTFEFNTLISLIGHHYPHTNLKWIMCNLKNITFNIIQQKLYVYQHLTDTICSINITKNEHNIFDIPVIAHTYGGKLEFTRNYFLVIDNCIHIIKNHDHHWIGSIANNSLTTLRHITDSFVSLDQGAAIYVSSKKYIVLIGGTNDIWEYGPFPGDIWVYSLTLQKWTKVGNISFQRIDFAAVLTSNQRYILLFGGCKYNVSAVNDDDVDDICVLDMKDDNNWKIKQCKIKCPYDGKFQAVRTGGVDSKNEILTVGYVKGCFRMKEFKQMRLPPRYIISIIAKYYSAEMIHLIKKGNHCGIYLKQILSSLC